MSNLSVTKSETKLFTTSYRIELHELRLDSIIRPKRTVGQLAISTEHNRPVILNLSLYRYLCLLRLTINNSYSQKYLKKGFHFYRCHPHQFETVFYEFGSCFDFDYACEMGILQIVDFIHLVKAELRRRNIHDLIAGNLSKDFYLNTHPSNVKFVPSKDNWSRGLVSRP